MGKYIYCDDNTLKGTNMDIVRIMVRTHMASLVNESIDVKINGIMLKIIEDSYGPLRIVLNQKGG